MSPRAGRHAAGASFVPPTEAGQGREAWGTGEGTHTPWGLGLAHVGRFQLGWGGWHRSGRRLWVSWAAELCLREGERREREFPSSCEAGGSLPAERLMHSGAGEKSWRLTRRAECPGETSVPS